MTTDLFPLISETAQAFEPHYGPAMRRSNEDAGLEGHDWGLLFLAMGLEPQPMTAARLHSLTPYVTVQALEARLAGAAGRGFLAPGENGEYHLTEAGHRAVKRSFEAAHARMATLEPLPAGDLRRVAELLRRMVEASLAATEPADRQHLLSSRLTDPGEDAPAATRIDQYLTDLARYRDDTHAAAWRPYDVGGPTWEMFTFIWRGDADSRETLAERLERREHAAETYTQAIQELLERGWIAEQEGTTYQVTERGRTLREEAENATDRYFYAPWSCLDEDELTELRGLLVRLRDGLQQTHTSDTN